MQVLFIDLDGVLNNEGYFVMRPKGHQQDYSDMGDVEHNIDNHNFAHLCYLCESRPSLKLVLSTDWRNVLELDDWNKVFTKLGCKNSIVGRTLMFGDREEEINKYLKDNSSIDEWAVIDDMTLHISNFVRTSPLRGWGYPETLELQQKFS